VRSSN